MVLTLRSHKPVVCNLLLHGSDLCCPVSPEGEGHKLLLRVGRQPQPPAPPRVESDGGPFARPDRQPLVVERRGRAQVVVPERLEAVEVEAYWRGGRCCGKHGGDEEEPARAAAAGWAPLSSPQHAVDRLNSAGVCPYSNTAKQAWELNGCLRRRSHRQ